MRLSSMKITLDGNELFDEHELRIEVGSINRESIERSVAGLDGIVSIDMGKRSRSIKQRGVLAANSRASMQQKIEAISACIDGDTHTLVTDSGQEYCDVRMDAFRVKAERAGGNGMFVDYEILYKQMVA